MRAINKMKRVIEMIEKNGSGKAGRIMRRRVPFDRNKVKKAMMKKSCRETYQRISDNTSISYENLRSCLTHGLIMPDHLAEIAHYLGVRKEELQ